MIGVNRRTFLQCGAIGAVGCLWPGKLGLAAGPSPARHIAARVVSSALVPPPAGKRVPFGWKTAAITAETPLLLDWPLFPADATATRLRLTCGLDVRDEKLIEVALAKSGRVIGTFDIRFASLFQPYEFAIKVDDAALVAREGVSLRLTKGADLRVFTGGEGIPNALLPHLLLPGQTSALDEYFTRMNSLACVQMFGWMEGCVLDGLLDLSELPAHAQLRKSAEAHLSKFIIDGKLIYESPVSSVADGRVTGIEEGLPFAALAKVDPKNPAIDIAVKFFNTRKGADGLIIDGNTTTSEGAYTVGYPLAVIGKARGDEALIQLALAQLRIRQARLFDGKDFWRTSKTGGGKGNYNWARGIAWQMVGLARTLRELKDRNDIADIVAAFKQLADWARSLQRDDGLWSVFAENRSLTPDTAGSAGIAAALAIGAQQGWLAKESRDSAAKCLEGLKRHLTPDGFLAGVSQSNKGGEPLQRGTYRVLFQMGMGLMAQLMAALETRD